jgi:hypothetical protein
VEETAIVNINVELPLSIETMNLEGWMLGIYCQKNGVACRTFSELQLAGMRTLASILR